MPKLSNNAWHLWINVNIWMEFCKLQIWYVKYYYTNLLSLFWFSPYDGVILLSFISHIVCPHLSYLGITLYIRDMYCRVEATPKSCCQLIRVETKLPKFRIWQKLVQIEIWRELAYQPSPAPITTPFNDTTMCHSAWMSYDGVWPIKVPTLPINSYEYGVNNLSLGV